MSVTPSQLKASTHNSGYFSLHTHSRFSVNDAMSGVDELVREAAAHGMPALGLTDHGSAAGWVQLYKNAKKHDIKALPGIELYVCGDRTTDARAVRHLTVAAYTALGYRHMTAIATMTARHFKYKPLIDMADLAELYEAGMTKGLVLGTGCYFGLGMRTLREQGPRAATHVVKTLAHWFPRTYVELHNHGVEHADENDQYGSDRVYVAEMVKIADELGLPYIIANDSHYTRADQQRLHNSLKQLISYSDDPDDAVFPAGPYSLMDEDTMRSYFDPEVADRAIESLRELADDARVAIPEVDVFTLKCPDVTYGGDPMVEISKRVRARMIELGLHEDNDAKARFEEELDVIEVSGMAGMLLLVAGVCDFIRAKKITFSARGSASDSFVVYLLQITQISPLSWRLEMDRFLSRDRTRPPDIDLDVEHARRGEVEQYLRDHFAVVQVGTNRLYKMTNDDDEEEEAGKGSLLQRYFTVRRKHDKTIEGRMTWADVPPEDRVTLNELAEMKLIAGYGTHAAGFVVAPSQEFLNQLPFSYVASSKTTTTAYGKKDVEALGFVKLDLLGLKELTGIRIACALAGMDESEIPLPEPLKKADKKVMDRIGQGDTDGLFQLKGWAMTKGVKDLKPRTLEDLAAAAALFRPATMKSGATQDFLNRRQGKAAVPVRHPDIAEVTSETYGVLLYQEQVISVLRRMQMPPTELTDMLDAIKASNEYVAGARLQIQEAIPRIKELATERGWDDDDIGWLTGSLEAYADYSFNKGHAAAYGVRSYQSAWLATYQPAAFWCGMMQAFEGSTGKITADDYVRWARRHSQKVRAADINRSGVSFTLDGDEILRGLQSVRQVGKITARELVRNQPYTDLTDLARKVIPGKVSGAAQLAKGLAPADCGGAIKHLWDAGALDSIMGDQ